jgi:ABC-type multidrug transport system fused ATPase/permease subunit
MKSIFRCAAQSFFVITPRGRFAVVSYTFFLILISAIDGIAIIRVSEFVSTIGNSNFSVNTQLIFVVFLFLGKSFLATVSSLFMFRQMSREEVYIGSHNFGDYQTLPWHIKINVDLSDLINQVDKGPSAIALSILSLSSAFIAELGGVIVLLCFFFYLDPITASASCLVFSLMIFFQHHFLSKGSARSGAVVKESGDLVIDILEDVNKLAKTLSVMPSSSLIADLEVKRSRLADARSRSLFYESLPRFLMEILMVIGTSVVAGFVLLLRGSDVATASLATFGIVGFRILPSINRIQGLVLGVIGKLPIANVGLKVPRKSLNVVGDIAVSERQNIDSEYVFSLDSISFKYGQTGPTILKDISFDFIEGYQYAVVGPSGAGKTTLIDMCIGLLEPTSGQIARRYQITDRAIGYVPQDTHLVRGGFDKNISLEWNDIVIDKDSVLQAMKDTDLLSLIPGQSPLANTNNLQISGGQKQRVGFARALYRNPKVLVLDESTSNLDAENESELVTLVEGLKGKVTSIIVAHRLTTVKNSDVVIYLADGEIKGFGTFEYLRQSLPEFSRQIELGSILK